MVFLLYYIYERFKFCINFGGFFVIYDSVENFLKNVPSVAPGVSVLAPLLNAMGRFSFEELKSMDFSPLDLRFGEYETKPAECVPFEAHRIYWDLQLVLDGEELVGCAPLASLTESVPYDGQNDIAFYSGEGDYVTLKEGMALLLAPWDGHKPGVSGKAVSHIKKIVVKLTHEDLCGKLGPK